MGDDAPVIGLKRGTVRLVPHDSEWAQLFELERQLLLQTFGSTIIEIEHVGSTAIPGIPAKPIIDINVGVASLQAALMMKSRFADLGYEHRPFIQGHTFEDLREQELYAKGPEANRTHYVHVAVHGSDFWNRSLLFRDYLRGKADRAQHYANLKTGLAQKFADDRRSYSNGKAYFIAQVLEEARACSEEA